MAKELCLIHANCQGDALKELLEASPGFTDKFEIRHLRNYKGEDLDTGLLDSAAIFLHQYLTEKWGEISTSQVLGRLSPKSQAICIPNCFFKGYWPLWVHKPEVIDFPDSLLENLLAKGLPPSDILRLYLRADPALTGDAEKIAQDTLVWEKEKETHTPIKYVDMIAENWRERQMFLTINHPAPALFVHIAQQILSLLSLPPVPESFAKNYVSPHDEFWLPIHPVIGQRLGLPFADAGRRYPAFGNSYTHKEYTLIYLACRQNGVKDLPAALAAHQALAQTAH